MSQVTEQSVRFQTALASIKLIQASAVLDLTEDDFDFLTSNKRSEERFSRNAETDLVCRLLLEKKKHDYPFLYQRQTFHQVEPNQANYQKGQNIQPSTYLE